jgi:hypothetical protein
MAPLLEVVLAVVVVVAVEVGFVVVIDTVFVVGCVVFELMTGPTFDTWISSIAMSPKNAVTRCALKTIR